MRIFCTLFDKNYLANFLALDNSIQAHLNEYKIYAFCMDDFSYNFLTEKYNCKNIETISLKELLLCYPNLVDLKSERSIVEFYFTCSPFICEFVFNKENSCTHITYLDADLYFFSSPEYVYTEISESSVAIIPHNFYGFGKRYVKYGIYNVGWVTFKNNETGRLCLNSWLKKCAEWCFDYYDKEYERFGDQKYLENWEREFGDVKIIKQKGANLAPWNVGQYKVQENKRGGLLIDEDLLVFYHFASFKKLRPNVYTTTISKYFTKPTKIVKELIYDKYLYEIYNCSKLISTSEGNEDAQVMVKNRVQKHSNSFRKLFADLMAVIRRWYFNDYIYLK